MGDPSHDRQWEKGSESFPFWSFVANGTKQFFSLSRATSRKRCLVLLLSSNCQKMWHVPPRLSHHYLFSFDDLLEPSHILVNTTQAFFSTSLIFSHVLPRSLCEKTTSLPGGGTYSILRIGLYCPSSFLFRLLFLTLTLLLSSASRTILKKVVLALILHNPI